MDTLVMDGDYLLDECGEVQNIYSIDEACQRVRLILSVKKGSYVYDRELGVDFSSLDSSQNRDKEAELLCREALVNQTEIEIGSVKITDADKGKNLSLTVIYKGISKAVEVKID